MLESAEDQNASSGKLVGNDTGLVGSGTSPMMQFESFGSRHSSSRTPLVSLYHSGKPLASSIGPTCLRPAVWFRWAGGGGAAVATNDPEATNPTAAAPPAKANRPRRGNIDMLMHFSLWTNSHGARLRNREMCACKHRPMPTRS